MKMIILTSLLLLITVVSCNTTDPKLEPELALKLEDVSCTEAWLQLTTNNLQLPVTINLLKNNTPSQFFNLNTKDSLLYIDSLLPNQSYKFKIVANNTDNPLPTTNEVLAQTMDTTSHNFTWQTFEFGQHSSSVLYDVAIINENDIWAVGEIYMNDSLGNPDLIRYNLAFWNGSSWEIKRIPYFYQGQPFYNPIQSVFAFSQNDIWFCGNGVIHWDGNSFIPMPIPTNVWGPYQMNKIWGSSSNDLYVVGNNGNIAHYQNGSWTKIESGATLNLTSISGNISGVYFSGVNSFINAGVLLKYKSNSISVLANGKIIGADEVFKPFLYGEFQTVNLIDNTLLLGGNFLYQFKFNHWNYVKSLPENFVNGNPNASIRGFIYSITANNGNDIIISGDRNTLLHFNGIDWLQLGEPYNPMSNIIHRNTRILNNIVVTVGYKGNKAMIMKLVR